MRKSKFMTTAHTPADDSPTERRRDSQDRFRLLFYSNPLPMWAYDAETLRFLEVNQAAIARYGYAREEFLAMTIRDIRPPEDVPRLLEVLQGEHTELRHAGVWRHRCKDGSVIYMRVARRDVEPPQRRLPLSGENDHHSRA